LELNELDDELNELEDIDINDAFEDVDVNNAFIRGKLARFKAGVLLGEPWGVMVTESKTILIESA